VALALAVWQLVGVNQNALYEQLLRTHIASARTAADSIDGYLEGRRALARALASDPRLVVAPGSETGQALLRDSLAAWSDSGVAGLGVLDAAGTLVVQVRTRDTAELVDAALAVAPREGTRIQSGDGSPWATIALPLADGAGSLVLVGDARPIARALAPDELGAEARRLLFERNGAPVWGTSVGAADLPPELKAAAFVARDRVPIQSSGGTPFHLEYRLITQGLEGMARDPRNVGFRCGQSECRHRRQSSVVQIAGREKNARTRSIASCARTSRSPIPGMVARHTFLHY
jgi:hypothetical protein